VIERLGAEITAALQDPAIAQRVRDFGAEPAPLAPAAYDAFMRAEREKWAPIVLASGVTVD
jgi:tripartite-type tricarboxylate transporter receptor subunit TctC